MTRCGFVAILGKPNAGKSTLVNQLVGYKVSIVSPKVQTTRQRILGIFKEGESQVILIDTPGLFTPKDSRPLEKLMAIEAKSSIREANVLLLLIDSTDKNWKSNLKILEKFPQDKPIIIALNKIDRLNKTMLLPMLSTLPPQKILLISALTGDGVEEIRKTLAPLLPEGPWIFEEDQLTTLSQRLWAAEITREQLYYQLQQELPYESTVETEAWENFDNGSIKISQAIIVGRETHKTIVVGHLATIGRLARLEIGKYLGCTVHLKLFVKVVSN